jgi:hypothetical protein
MSKRPTKPPKKGSRPMAPPKKIITVNQPKEGQPPTETLVLQWLLEPETVNVSTTTPSTTAVPGSTLQIDLEYMIVTNATAPDRLVVKRAAFDTAAVEHVEGATVSVWGKTESGLPGKHPLARSELKGVGATMTRQMTGEEATASRSRIDNWPPPLKTHSEHVEELETEADAQANYNGEIADMQMKAADALVGKLDPPPLLDPDEARSVAKEAAAASMDPATKEKAVKAMTAVRRAQSAKSQEATE